MAQGSFFPLQSYSKKTLTKNVPKSTRKYKRNVLMPLGHPIILLKSNEFNMAVVSVKRSIVALILLPYKGKNDTLFKDGDPQKPYPIADRERRFPKHP